MNESLYIKQLQVGPMENFIYLIGDQKVRECVMVDPAWDADAVIRQAEKDGMRVVAGVLTHTHFDHSNAAEELVRRTNGKIYVHENEAGFIRVPEGALETTRDGYLLSLGETEIRFLHTPGHTPGGQCLLVGGHLFSGDTLFVNACGRCDLEGSSLEAMYSSLQRIAALGDDVVVLPGHDYGDLPTSTIDREKKNNPYYQCRSLQEFLALRS